MKNHWLDQKKQVDERRELEKIWDRFDEIEQLNRFIKPTNFEDFDDCDFRGADESFR